MAAVSFAMGGIWRPGDRFKQFGGMLSREALANWLLCVVINFTTQEIEQSRSAATPSVATAIIHHDASGFAVPTEHVFVPPGGAAAAGNIENLILAKIQQKHVKGGEAYASGKTPVVFLDSGGGPWYPRKVADQLPDPIYFDGIWVVGLQEGRRWRIHLRRNASDLAGSPKWRVRIAPDFDDWTVEPILSRVELTTRPQPPSAQAPRPTSKKVLRR